MSDGLLSKGDVPSAREQLPRELYTAKVGGLQDAVVRGDAGLR